MKDTSGDVKKIISILATKLFSSEEEMEAKCPPHRTHCSSATYHDSRSYNLNMVNSSH
uniref:Ovule protein n=1 Tax=Heterorhabditis bacteriophora TaxID=37862 RepID=A0A1I7X8W1_HETBA